MLAQRVEMTQDGRPVLDAMVWSVGQVEGLEHVDVTPPEVSDPADTPPWIDRRHDADGDDADGRRRTRSGTTSSSDRSTASATWPPPGPLPPTWRTWVRYKEGDPGTEDAWVQAARLLVVLDVGSWPAGSRPHAHAEPPFIAPSLDLYAAFQDPTSGSEWLLLDAHSPVAQAGLLSWTGRVWSEARTLLASGGGQAVFRHT